MAKEKKIKVTLQGSKFGRKPGHRECIEGLGLRRRHHSRVVVDTPANRGMMNQVSYLLKIEEV